MRSACIKRFLGPPKIIFQFLALGINHRLWMIVEVCLALRTFLKSVSDCAPFDLLFVLDSSGSVYNHYYQQKQFMDILTNKLTIAPDQHRVGVVAYSGQEKNIEIRFDQFQNDKEDLLDEIK